MKIQLDGQSLRLRIGEDELARLLGGDAVDAATTLSPQIALRWRLLLCDIAAPELRAAPEALCVRLPREAFEAFASARPRRDGLHFDWTDTGADPLQVTVEIDVRDSHRRGVQRSIGQLESG
ncbi:MAG: hypothetical protein KF800_07790 [Lysobacter sp.]|nr:hypothetical protein [Lysobacter sp.]